MPAPFVTTPPQGGKPTQPDPTGTNSATAPNPGGVNNPGGPSMVDLNAPQPQVPLFWDDFGRQAAALFEILALRGKPAADSFQAWLAAERAKKP